MKNGVRCKNCENVVIPRIWHRNIDSRIYHRQNQHICPICGVTMYVTGGGLTVLGNTFLHSAAAFFIWLLITSGIREFLKLSHSASSNLALAVLFLISTLYIAKRFFGVAFSSILKKRKLR